MPLAPNSPSALHLKVIEGFVNPPLPVFTVITLVTSQSYDLDDAADALTAKMLVIEKMATKAQRMEMSLVNVFFMMRFPFFNKKYFVEGDVPFLVNRASLLLGKGRGGIVNKVFGVLQI